MNDITLTMIKPDAVSRKYQGKIIDMILQAGFRIKAMKMLHMTKQQAQQFYMVHKDKPFYNDLTDFMSSGPIIAAILEKENAVADFRKLIGATNPAEAESGTIRKLFAESIQNNAVHGSDCNENAHVEANFFFSEMERV